MHLMNDPRQVPMDVLLALVSKCKQDRDVASVYDYLKARATASKTPFPQPAIMNQAFAAQQGASGGGESTGRVWDCYYRGMTCKFGDQYRHAHLEKGSAARREFERNPAKMERYSHMRTRCMHRQVHVHECRHEGRCTCK